MPFWKTVKDKVWKAWQATIDNWLLHHSNPCAVVCALLAILFLSLGFLEARVLSSTSAQLISSPTEATPDKFGGLEAFVLDGFQDKVVPPALPPNVAIYADKLDGLVANPEIPVDRLNLHINLAKNPGLRTQYISDENRQVFLFIPATALASHQTANVPLKGPVTLQSLGVANDSLLARDIAAGISASDSLKQIMDASGELDANNRFKQVYLVSATGALRDFNDGGSDDNTFVAHRFFPERPYFWPTIEHLPTETNCPAPFTFCTRPYVDLGGHGVVVTMCRAAGQGFNTSDTVLCADTSYPTAATIDTINKEIRPFSTQSGKEIVCHTSNAGVFCDHSDKDEDSQLVEASLREVVGQQRPEEMLGAIYKIKSTGQSPYERLITGLGKIPYVGKPILSLYPISGASFSFTFPLSVKRDSDTETINFLLCFVDFANPTSKLIISVTGGTIFIAGLFVSIFYSFQARRKSLAFISSLEEVMKVSPVPFVHLSEDGKMIGANQAFQDLVGVELIELKRRTFYSMLDQPSKARYQIIADCRRQKLLTKPYEIRIFNGTGELLPVVACGSALDMPRTSEFRIAEPAATFLHSFGIVVPRSSFSDLEFKRVDPLQMSLSLDDFRQLATNSAHAA
jgi:PAS domain-containing protein